MAIRHVEITVTSTMVGNYEARSYPDEQDDANGFYNLYRVPLYKILVTGTDTLNHPASIEFMAPRFMPYFNNPANPDKEYKATGWLNAGLSGARRVVVTKYKADYAVQNRYSPGRGAIVIEGSFYIHAGPAAVNDFGFGSAGCIEIIGDYNDFKQSIAQLSGLTGTPDHVIQHLVTAGKLVVKVESAKVPDIKANFTRKIHD